MLLRGCVDRIWVTARWYVFGRRERHGATYTALQMEPRHSELRFVTISNFVDYRGEISIVAGRDGDPKTGQDGGAK